MIVGLKQSIPYVVKTLPEKKLDGEWNYHPVENPYFDRFASLARQEQQFRACQKAAHTKLPV